MNVLIINAIMPVPGLINTNDFIIPLCKTISHQHPDIKFHIIHPLTLNPFSSAKRITHRMKVYELEGFTVHVLPHLSFRRLRNFHSLISYSIYLFNRKWLSRFFTTHKIDLIHAENLLPDGLLANILSRKYNIPYLIRSHKELWYFPHLISRRICLNILQQAVKVLPLNYFTADLYRKFGINNIKMIPHGIDAGFLEQQCAYKGAPVKIVSVGRLVRYKNFDRLIKVLSFLHREGTDFSFTLIGNGPEKARLQNLVNRLGLTAVVTFIEKVSYSQMPREMASHHIFILTSYFETFGRVYFESMATGLPVICTKGTGVHGFMKEGEEALSVSHTRIDEIYATLKFLIDNPSDRERIGLNGKRLVTGFTNEQVANTFYQVYSNILADRP